MMINFVPCYVFFSYCILLSQSFFLTVYCCPRAECVKCGRQSLDICLTQVLDMQSLFAATGTETEQSRCRNLGSCQAKKHALGLQ